MSIQFLYRVSSSIDTSNKMAAHTTVELTPCTDDKFPRDQADVYAHWRQVEGTWSQHMPAGTSARIIIVTKPLEDPRTLPVEIGTVLCGLYATFGPLSSVNTLETTRHEVKERLPCLSKGLSI